MLAHSRLTIFCASALAVLEACQSQIHSHYFTRKRVKIRHKKTGVPAQMRALDEVNARVNAHKISISKPFVFQKQ